MKKVFTIIICTYGRQELLNHALTGIEQADFCAEVKEVIVVNNKLSDDIVKWSSSFPYELHYKNESKKGLAYARNKGATLANGNWLLYLDDDGVIEPQTLVEASKMIRDFNFEMFTGIYTAWNYYNTPKWFPEEWAAYQLKGNREIRALGADYISGGIMAIKKSVLQDLGFFPTNLGMNGDKINYGEETYIEKQLRTSGRSLGINPKMVLKHVVGKHKHKLSWLLRAYYAKGRASAQISELSVKNVHTVVASLFVRCIKNVVKSGFKLLTKKEYFYQNFILDIAGPLLSYCGMLKYIFTIQKRQIVK